MQDGYRRTGPERIAAGLGQGEVALQHIHRILLEGEDGAIVEHAEQGHEPETAIAKNLADVADFERIVLLLSLTSLCIELLVHEEVDDGHDEGDAQQYHTEGYAAADAHLTAQTGKEG